MYPNKGSFKNQGGSKNAHWKGGISQHTKGYLYEYAPDNPAADKRGYVLQHRLVAEKKLGRPLRPEEIPHHLDTNKANNEPSNLLIFPTTGEHSRYEAQLRKQAKYQLKHSG